MRVLMGKGWGLIDCWVQDCEISAQSGHGCLGTGLGEGGGLGIGQVMMWRLPEDRIVCFERMVM